MMQWVDCCHFELLIFCLCFVRLRFYLLYSKLVSFILSVREAAL